MFSPRYIERVISVRMKGFLVNNLLHLRLNWSLLERWNELDINHFHFCFLLHVCNSVRNERQYCVLLYILACPCNIYIFHKSLSVFLLLDSVLKMSWVTLCKAFKKLLHSYFFKIFISNSCILKSPFKLLIFCKMSFMLHCLQTRYSSN